MSYRKACAVPYEVAARCRRHHRRQRDLLLAVATSLGAIIAASAGFFAIAKWVGAAYLIYLGVKAVRSGRIESRGGFGSLVAGGKR